MSLTVQAMGNVPALPEWAERERDKREEKDKELQRRVRKLEERERKSGSEGYG